MEWCEEALQAGWRSRRRRAAAAAAKCRPTSAGDAPPRRIPRSGFSSPGNTGTSMEMRGAKAGSGRLALDGVGLG